MTQSPRIPPPSTTWGFKNKKKGGRGVVFKSNLSSPPTRSSKIEKRRRMSNIEVNSNNATGQASSRAAPYDENLY